MRKMAALLIAVGLLLTAGSMVAYAAPGNPHHEEQDGCDHGNANKPCKDDPQPDHGQDCLEHGNHGGINEDHCATPTPTPTPTPTDTPTPTPTPTVTPTEPPFGEGGGDCPADDPCIDLTKPKGNQPKGLAKTGPETALLLLLAGFGFLFTGSGLLIRKPSRG